jgi:hypothetical protein
MHEVKYSVGLDLGQASDPTACTIIRHERKPGAGIVHVRQPNSSVVKTRDIANRYDCVHLHRYPLGTVYPAIVQDIKKLMRTEPLCGVPQTMWHDADGKLCADPGNPPATLIVDATGVGHPVCDLLTEAGVRHQRVSITSGAQVDQASRRQSLGRAEKFAHPTRRCGNAIGSPALRRLAARV